MKFLDPIAQTTQWQESIRLAVGALRVDKMKASLTMLSVVIGSAAIVLVITISSTGKAYILSQIEGIGSNLAYASLDRGTGDTLEDELTLGDLAAVREGMPSLAQAAGTYDWPVSYQANGQIHHARLVGVTRDFQKIRRLIITSGRYFDEEDFRSHSKVCLVTDVVAQTLYGGRNAVGGSVQLGDFRCTIIATFKEGVPTFGQSEIQDQTLLVPFPLIKNITGDNFLQVIYAQAAQVSDVGMVTDQLHKLLSSRHNKRSRYSVQNLSSILQTAQSVSIGMTVLLLLLAILTLTVAGTGIMNIMLVNVAQRTREIGVRMALGARPKEIRLQFLMEAFFISFGGALIGVAVALGLIWWTINLSEGVTLEGAPWIAVIVALVLSTGMGVLFGYKPASTAANMNPVEALRHE